MRKKISTHSAIFTLPAPPFKPAWWLRGPHLQTLWAPLLRRSVKIATRRERVELPDGDYLDCDWAGAEQGPIVIILHGVGGNLKSAYARGLLRALTQQGWRGLFLHFRGCSGEPNRLARQYHSGETADFAYLLHLLKAREPTTTLAAIGISLGGSVLLNWLAQNSQTQFLSAAIAVSVPFELHKAATAINRGFARLYQWHLLRGLRRSLLHATKLAQTALSRHTIARLRTFWQFDDVVTAPLHGFKDVHDYYARASCRPHLKKITTPTLLLHARDDPFMPAHAVPAVTELSPQVTIALSASGGHAGFVAGHWPWRPIYWLEQCAVHYLKNYI